MSRHGGLPNGRGRPDARVHLHDEDASDPDPLHGLEVGGDPFPVRLPLIQNQ